MLAVAMYLGTEGAWWAWQHHVWSGTVVSSPADKRQICIQDSLNHKQGQASIVPPANVLLHCLQQGV